MNEMLHFQWGKTSRSYVVGIRKVHSVLKPWLCFSLYSKDRTYDFIVPEGPDEDRVLQIMVLAFSALMKHKCSGLLHSRGKFIVKRALMKIDEQCKWKGVTRGALIKEALLKTASESGPSGPGAPMVGKFGEFKVEGSVKI